MRGNILNIFDDTMEEGDTFNLEETQSFMQHAIASNSGSNEPMDTQKFLYLWDKIVRIDKTIGITEFMQIYMVMMSVKNEDELNVTNDDGSI